ncbi:MAG: hypothetical protein Kow0042_30990 [Calditrichia bacterium]
MKYIHKLKPLNEWWVGLLYIGNGVLLLLAALFGFWDFYLKFLGTLFLLVAAIRVFISFRMGNYAYLAGALHYSVIAFLCFAITGENKALITALMGIFFFTLFLNVAMFVSRKVKWRWREVLELAAYPVKDTKNGFTTRPKPTGKADYSREDILAFAGFLAKHLIAIPYVEKEKVALVITKKRLKHLLNLKNDYSDETYISFDFKGNVTVNITKQDYLQYKDALTFDQLTDSMGNLFIEFLELFKKGEAVRIIDRMNELKMNPFEGAMLI